MAITVSDISALVARYGNERIHEQVNMLAPFLKMVDELKLEGQVGFVNLKGGGLDSTVHIADSGTLPAGAARDVQQASYLPKFVFSRGAIPRGAASLATGKKDGINIVFEQLDSMGADLGRTLARGLIKKLLHTLTAGEATDLGAATTSVTLSTQSGFRPGSVIERRDSGGTLEEYLRVTGVTIDDNGTSHVLTVVRNITIGNGVTPPNGAPAADDELYLVGAFDQGMTTLDEAADETTAVYSVAVTSDNWSGNTRDIAGALDVQAMRDMWSKTTIRRGLQPDFVLANSRVRQLYSDTLLADRRYISGRMDATGGVEIDFEGHPVKVDENVPSDSLYYICKKDYKIHCFKSFMDDADGGAKSPSASGHALVSQSAFDYDFQRWGAYNSRVTRRNGLASLTGITG